MSLIALALAATLSGVQSTDPNERDLQCAAVFAIALNDATEETQAGLIGGVYYFLGRIEGRQAGYDVESNIRRLLDRPNAEAMIEANRARCSDQLAQKANELIVIGKSRQGL